MSLRSILILGSLAANLILVISVQSSLSKVQALRQATVQLDSEASRLKETAGRIAVTDTGLSTRTMGLELALLQKIKVAVGNQIAKNKGRDLRCARGPASELNTVLNTLAEYKKKLDILILNNEADARNREEIVARIEDQARKMKEELISLCTGR